MDDRASGRDVRRRHREGVEVPCVQVRFDSIERNRPVDELLEAFWGEDSAFTNRYVSARRRSSQEPSSHPEDARQIGLHELPDVELGPDVHEVRCARRAAIGEGRESARIQRSDRRSTDDIETQISFERAAHFFEDVLDDPHFVRAARRASRENEGGSVRNDGS